MPAVPVAGLLGEAEEPPGPVGLVELAGLEGQAGLVEWGGVSVEPVGVEVAVSDQVPVVAMVAVDPLSKGNGTIGLLVIIATVVTGGPRPEIVKGVPGPVGMPAVVTSVTGAVVTGAVVTGAGAGRVWVMVVGAPPLVIGVPPLLILGTRDSNAKPEEDS
ncbi:UNVERIFIED_CONTAM: hypothetical protein K2H54_005241 [Gekko kuhli]